MNETKIIPEGHIIAKDLWFSEQLQEWTQQATHLLWKNTAIVVDSNVQGLSEK